MKLPLQALALAAAVTVGASAIGCSQHDTNLISGDAVERMIDRAVAQVGDGYLFGVEVSDDDPDPDLWDQGEFTQWVAHQGGVDIPGSSVEQYLDLKSKGLLVPLDIGVTTKGALLFAFSQEPQPGGSRPLETQSAVSLGDGRTVEASSQDLGVAIAADAQDRFDYAAVLATDATPPWSLRRAQQRQGSGT